MLTLRKKSHINNLNLYFKELEKEEQTNPKASRGKEIIKIRTEISKTGSRKTIEKIREAKSWLLKKINQSDSPLS